MDIYRLIEVENFSIPGGEGRFRLWEDSNGKLEFGFEHDPINEMNIYEVRYEDEISQEFLEHWNFATKKDAILFLWEQEKHLYSSGKKREINFREKW